jgi:tripartite motif-containing protein 37
MYDFHLRVLRTEEGKVKVRKEELRAVLGDIEENLDKLKHAHGEKSDDLRGRIEVLRGRLETAYKERAVQLVGKQRFVAKEIEQFQELISKVNASLSHKGKAHLIANAPAILAELRQVNLESQGEIDFIPQCPDYSNVSITPQFESGSFIIEEFSRYRNSSEVLYSDPLPINGMNWRLKVYPNGNGFAMGVYVSLFLEMRSSLSGVSKYEYKVEMENRRDVPKPMIREFASDFESGECWGYNRFIRIDALCDEGFLDPEEDKIFLKYYVRAQTFAQQCKDQQRYIDFLENDKQQISDRLSDLHTKLQTYESPAKAVRLPSPPVIISAENPLEHIGDNVEVHSEDEQVQVEEDREEEIRSDDDLEAMTRKLKLLSKLRLQERRKRQNSSEASHKSSEESEEVNPASWQEDEDYRSSGSDLSELDVPRPNPSSEAPSAQS